MISLVLTIIVVGVLLWLATTYIPMNPTIKQILVAVVIIGLVLYILNDFGVFAYIDKPLPRLHK
jgi:hypothetical protein